MTADVGRLAFSVDPWDPGYGMAFGESWMAVPLEGVVGRARPGPGAARRRMAPDHP